MGVLCKAELARRIEQGDLIENVRLKDGKPDLQPASYDLSAGRAVWKEPRRAAQPPQIVERTFDDRLDFIHQNTVTLHPGQMMTVITRESLKMPRDLCGNVFSKNRLALSGIFAFNAGHVDPGYHGQIVIRLISLRETTWTLTLGAPIFTIVFQTLEAPGALESLPFRPAISASETLQQVRDFADVALSNALFSLYVKEINDQLSDHRIDILNKLREDLGKDFVKREQIGHALLAWAGKRLLVLIGVIASVVGIVAKWSDIKKLF